MEISTSTGILVQVYVNNITGLNIFESATLNYSEIPGEINNFKLITN